jgi:hypothetical protein
MSTLKTGKVKTTTIADELDTESTAVTNVINGSAKAWVNFNGTGTVAIRESFNVSSVVDTAIGKYTVNLTNAITDANYVITAGVSDDGSSYNNQMNCQPAPDFTPTTTVFKLTTGNTISAGADDFERIYAVIHR